MPQTITLSLVSHTNVGKTTLARTLLGRDVGIVRDQAHVTESAEPYPMIETADGDRMTLWDTPGFGDSVRLARRLAASGDPIGWFLSQVWDRFRDRPFWSSQQAVRNARDAADVVLYLVNASEPPAAAGYLASELSVLEWIGKPVVVLLNQLGPPRAAHIEAGEVQHWASHLAPYPWVRDTVAFDAFARCWVQEHALLDRIGAALPPERDAAFARLAKAWRARNRSTFEGSMRVLARQLALTAADNAATATRSAGARARDWLASLLGQTKPGDAALDAAMAQLALRLDTAVRSTTDELIALHGLSGRAAAEILQRMGTEYAVDRPADPDRASLIGAAVSGALGGLAADLAAGGLTFGAGALLGGVLGAAGARGLASACNLARGREVTTVRWSAEFVTGRVSAAVLRYLAVAHFGRGRGDYVAGEYPPHWAAVVRDAVATRRPVLEAAWAAAAAGEPAPVLESRLVPQLEAIVSDVLEQLYPPSQQGDVG